MKILSNPIDTIQEKSHQNPEFYRWYPSEKNYLLFWFLSSYIIYYISTNSLFTNIMILTLFLIY